MDVKLLRSRLYPYAKNCNGAWDHFLHVRLQIPGRPHPSPPPYDPKKMESCHADDQAVPRA